MATLNMMAAAVGRTMVATTAPQTSPDLFALGDGTKAFSRNNFLISLLRPQARRVIESNWFKRLSLLVILANCVGMGAADPCDSECRKPLCQFIQQAEHVIFVFFFSEMILKMMALGVWSGDEAYLSDSWNRFDFFIVLVSASEYAFASSNINFTAIRAIRVLRPLRAINRIKSLRLLITLLLDILPMMGNVLILFFFIFSVFGIVAVQLWAGLLRQRCFFPPEITAPGYMPLYYKPPDEDYICSEVNFGNLPCSAIAEEEQSNSMCEHLFAGDEDRLEICYSLVLNYTECRQDGPNPWLGTLNFDNIGMAWVTVFQVISLESWTDIMYMIQDAYSFWVWIYFVILVMIGAYLTINLCLVVVATQFKETKVREAEQLKLLEANAVQEELSDSSGDDEDENAEDGNESDEKNDGLYAETVKTVIHFIRRRCCPNRHRKAIAKARLPLLPRKRPETCGQRCLMFIKGHRKFLRKLLSHNVVLIISGVIILLNAVIMAAEHYEQPQQLTQFIEYSNLVFTFVFVFELSLKFYAYGPYHFILNAFNVIDSVIIAINVIELLSSGGGSSGFSILRLFRLIRLVKILHFLPEDLKKQLMAMVRTVDNVATFFLLLGFFLFISSLFGMSLFGCKFCEGNRHDKAHQATFGSAAGNMPNRSATACNNGTCKFQVLSYDLLAEARKSLRKINSTGLDDSPRCSVVTFDSLPQSLFTVMQIFTQDNWSPVMRDGMYFTSGFSALYFFAVVTVGNYIIFNLLIAILVEGFCGMDDDGPELKITIFGSTDCLASMAEQRARELLKVLLPAAKLLKLERKKRPLGERIRLAFRNNNSLFIFGPENRLRRRLNKLLSSRKYERRFLIVILLSCVTIILERPDLHPVERHILSIANHGFTLLFVTEAVLKSIAFGFAFGPRCLLKDVWGRIDFILVLAGLGDILLDILPHDPEHEAPALTIIWNSVRIFTMLRALRPCRIVSRARGLKIVLETLMLSIKPIGNIVFICFVFFGVFSILGVQLYSGCFAKCDFHLTLPENYTAEPDTITLLGPSAKTKANRALLETVQTKSECLQHGFDWQTEPYNFNSLPQAFMTLFVFSTLDGWAAITRNGADCAGADRQPVPNASPFAYFYFISFLLIVCFFALNMFVGVVVNNFERVQKFIEQQCKQRLCNLQTSSVLARIASRNGPPQIPPTAEGDAETDANGNPKDPAHVDDDDDETDREALYWTKYSKPRLAIYKFVTNDFFEITIIGLTLVNLVMMACEFYQQPALFNTIIHYVSIFFLVLMAAEATLKVIAFGPLRFIVERWNQIDLFIFIISFLGIILEAYIPFNPTLIRAARVFRIARAFKLLKSAQGIRHLIDTIANAIPHVMYLSVLFLLLFFVYAALGVQLYGTFKCPENNDCEGLSRHANFHNFGTTMLTLFRIFTGDNWNAILKDMLAIAGNPTVCQTFISHSTRVIPCSVIQFVSPSFFISFVLLTQFFLINIVVAVLMRNLQATNTVEEETTATKTLQKASIATNDVEQSVRRQTLNHVEQVEKEMSRRFSVIVEPLLHAAPSLCQLSTEHVVQILSAEYVIKEQAHNIAFASIDRRQLWLPAMRQSISAYDVNFNRSKRHFETVKPSRSAVEFTLADEANGLLQNNDDSDLIRLDLKLIQESVETASETISELYRMFSTDNINLNANLARFRGFANPNFAMNSPDADNNDVVLMTPSSEAASSEASDLADILEAYAEYRFKQIMLTNYGNSKFRDEDSLIETAATTTEDFNEPNFDTYSLRYSL